jgi:hypothetical protein
MSNKNRPTTTVKQDENTELVNDQVEMEKVPIKQGELNDILRRAENEDNKLSEEDIPHANPNLDVEAGENVTLKQTHPGRPIDVESKKQHDLLVKVLKQKLGINRKGRAVDPSSKRQQTLAERKEKAEKGLLKKGRPAYTPEQKEIAEKEKAEREKARIEELEKMADELIATGKVSEVLAELKENK